MTTCTPASSPAARQAPGPDQKGSPLRTAGDGGEGVARGSAGAGDDTLTASKFGEQKTLPISPTPGAPPQFPFSERALRYRLGLAEDDIRALRHRHLSDSDFVRYKKAVYLTAAGVAAICRGALAHFAEKTAPRPPTAHPGQIKKAPAQIETLLVSRANLANPHLLLACSDNDDPDRPRRVLRVRVRSTVNFVPRMKIPAVLVDGYSDLYDLARNLPRKKGKW